MARSFLELTTTPSVLRAQEAAYGRARPFAGSALADALGPAETEFITRRDSFYLATVSESGWPYVQHRGGAPGFLRVLGPSSLAFADYGGNRQLLTTGNVGTGGRVALFLMDYPNRRRLKILGRAHIESPRDHPARLARVADPSLHPVVERLFVIEVAGFDWNCPKYITPRYSAEEVSEIVAPLTQRIEELERQLADRPRGDIA